MHGYDNRFSAVERAGRITRNTIYLRKLNRLYTIILHKCSGVNRIKELGSPSPNLSAML